MRRSIGWLALPTLLLLAACSESTTAPDATLDEAELLAFEAAAVPGGPSGRAAGHYLPSLLRQAVRQVRTEQGDDAAAALTADLRALIEEGRAIRESGDREAMQAHMALVRVATAEIVLAVLGDGVVADALAKAAEAIAALEARIAEGGLPDMAAQKLADAQAQYDAALAADAAGDDAAALSAAAHAIEIAVHGPPRHRGGRRGR